MHAVEKLQGGDREEARADLLQLWTRTSGMTGRERCIIAHFLADTEEDVGEELGWDLQALELATGSRTPTIASTVPQELLDFLPSLYLNVGDAYRRMGAFALASEHARAGLSCARRLDANDYINHVITALERLGDRSLARNAE